MHFRSNTEKQIVWRGVRLQFIIILELGGREIALNSQWMPTLLMYGHQNARVEVKLRAFQFDCTKTARNQPHNHTDLHT